MSQSILFHIIVMALGVTVLLGAGYIGKTDKGGRNLNTHKAVAAVGIMLVLVEVVALILTEALMLTLPHFFIAAAAIAFMLLAPIGGLLYVKAVPAKKAALRKSHRFDAMIFFGLAGAAIVFGVISVLAMLE